jgi:hypothetical protein
MRAVIVAVALVTAGSSAAVAQGVQAPVFEDAMRANASLQIAAQRSTLPQQFILSADVAAQQHFSSRAPGATLMIAGGAAVLAGILVGGSGGALLILGGVGAGAYGFYLYNR